MGVRDGNGLELHPKLRGREFLQRQGCIHDLRRACCYTTVETVSKCNLLKNLQLENYDHRLGNKGEEFLDAERRNLHELLSR
jgi:hypothetical protein